MSYQLSILIAGSCYNSVVNFKTVWIHRAVTW